MLTIADKGGGGSEIFSTKGFYGYKNVDLGRRFDLDLTIHDKQRHITCKLDHDR